MTFLTPSHVHTAGAGFWVKWWWKLTTRRGRGWLKQMRDVTATSIFSGSEAKTDLWSMGCALMKLHNVLSFIRKQMALGRADEHWEMKATGLNSGNASKTCGKFVKDFFIASRVKCIGRSVINSMGYTITTDSNMFTRVKNWDINIIHAIFLEDGTDNISFRVGCLCMGKIRDIKIK